MRSPIADCQDFSDKYVPMQTWEDIRHQRVQPIDHSCFDERMQELERLIQAGWGDVPQGAIPANWTEVKAPTPHPNTNRFRRSAA